MAGATYLIVVVAGMFSLAYVPAQYTVVGNKAATMANILAHEPLFRAGIAAAVVCYLAFLLLPFLLWRVLNSAGRAAAGAMVVLAAVSAPMALLNLGRRVDVLTALGTGDTAGAAAALSAYGNGLLMVQLFWGLWLLPLGWLVFRSAAIPRVIGILLMIGCFGYLIRIFGEIVFPAFDELPGAQFISIPGSVGEISTALWLFIMGAREDRLGRFER